MKIKAWATPILISILLITTIIGLGSISNLEGKDVLELDDTGITEIDYDSQNGVVYVSIYNRGEDPETGNIILEIDGAVVEEREVVVDQKKEVYLDFDFNSPSDRVSVYLESDGEPVRGVGFMVDRYPEYYTLE
ncbi:hypothetical protein [Methanonatronarchaeum sp. AMET6-2]|uniref:hypothetical protein n=1 Tax=Methanonatronarchaeum sp. AMET6-2 TaxID=2933293 RepID=UPI00122BEDFD|nr:hypothetical protein [Methanonatronarchaeum sp. AMET6-2]RZN62920.1 MAG: hypothetical protein EF811_01690 [Methanonatronarchaeia archaeon]UOY09852.1 hypothetical protein MU439_06210 [Methanonatronarchaeum sp. AMET6-2]